MSKSVVLIISASLMLFALAVGVAVWLRTDSPDSADGYVPRPPGILTFNKDISPILFEHCARCHRPGESAPFALLSYQDAKKRGAQIVEATQTRFMPPWLPESGFGKFVGERRLSADQIGMIQQWVEEGLVEGVPADLPALPQWPQGWQLGEPDLVVELPQPYQLPADGTDVFRNFVIPIPITEQRYVKAVELRPGNRKIVHHAEVLVDRTGSLRGRDAEDAEPGFDGMDGHGAYRPDGHLLGWTPGKTPSPASDEMAWTLLPDTDLVLLLHMIPSGKPELIQPKIGLYFTGTPPTRTPVLLRLGSQTIDIPAGKKDYVIEDEYQLPVDVDVRLIYPHAHYLAKEMKALAMLPSGEKRWLIHINDWDFFWQDDYEFENPISLPKGSVLKMRFTYDNSDQNLRNPNNPVRRVIYGPDSTDEMGDLWLQLVPQAPEDFTLLNQDVTRKEFFAREARWKHVVETDPENAEAHYNLGTILQALGSTEEAIAEYQDSLRIEPDYAKAQNNWGVALMRMDRFEEAMEHYQDAVRIEPDYAEAQYNWGQALMRMGRFEEAVMRYQDALRIKPDYAEVHYNSGVALRRLGRTEEAVAHYQSALRIKPDFAEAHNDLGTTLQGLGRMEEAVAHYQDALRIKPGYAKAHNNWGIALEKLGRFTEAATHYQDALRINPDNAEAHNNLAWLWATCPDDSVRDGQQALQHAQRAVQLVGEDKAALLDSLSAAYAELGNFEEAVRWQETAVQLAPEKLKEVLGGRLDLYKRLQPYREQLKINSNK